MNRCWVSILCRHFLDPSSKLHIEFTAVLQIYDIYVNRLLWYGLSGQYLACLRILCFICSEATNIFVDCNLAISPLRFSAKIYLLQLSLPQNVNFFATFYCLQIYFNPYEVRGLVSYRNHSLMTGRGTPMPYLSWHIPETGKKISSQRGALFSFKADNRAKEGTISRMKMH